MGIIGRCNGCGKPIGADMSGWCSTCRPKQEERPRQESSRGGSPTADSPKRRKVRRPSRKVRRQYRRG